MANDDLDLPGFQDKPNVNTECARRSAAACQHHGSPTKETETKDIQVFEPNSGTVVQDREMTELPSVEWLKARIRRSAMIGPARMLRTSIASFTMRAVYARQHRAIRRHTWTKLQLGCGSNFLDGWLNSDFVAGPKAIYVDATRKLPFIDASFEYAFTEHMIEHISFEHGRRFLAEIYRVLRPGGKVRVATPDMHFLARLLHDNLTATERRYIGWAVERWRLPSSDPASVVNNFFRDWGHLYIYDERSLSGSLSYCGFRNIVRREIGESDDAALCNLESHGKVIGEEWNRLETMVLEAQK